jgi:predicted negative regulator of RcsB-dependent stress response
MKTILNIVLIAVAAVIGYTVWKSYQAARGVGQSVSQDWDSFTNLLTDNNAGVAQANAIANANFSPALAPAASDALQLGYDPFPMNSFGSMLAGSQ